jgi:cytochrome b
MAPADDTTRARSTTTVPVWDGATRLFHWAIVVLALFSWLMAETDQLDWHRRSGYTILTLLLFRLAWGFVGSETARFRSFVRGPAAILGYARHFLTRRPSHTIGHNPMGALSVMGLLALLLLQTGTGLFSVDTDGVESGPLAGLISYNAGRTAAHIHSFVFTLIQILVVLHVAVILFYAFYKRENLVGPMISGRKTVPGTAVPPARASTGTAIVVLAIAAAIVYGIVTWLPKLARLL